MADPLLISAGVNIGSSLLGSVFGGESPAGEAQKMLLRFGKEGLPPEILNQIISDALISINRGVQMEKRGVASRLAAGGIDARSGLAQSQFDKVARAGFQSRGRAMADANFQNERFKLDAVRAVAGMGDNTGAGFLETLARTSGNLLPVLAQRGNMERRQLTPTV